MGDELSPLANHGRPKKRERKGVLMGEVCGSWNFGKAFGLKRKEGKKKKEKGKRKRNYKEKIFS